MLLAFYRGTGTDTEGRTLDEILGWDDDRLERCHDYIQWLFPNPTPSAVNPDAPRLTAGHSEAFAREPELRKNLLRALLRMLRFYGLTLSTEDGRPRVIRAANWQVRRAQWLTPGNHNHLRLTRVLICLNQLGFPEHARALFALLDEVGRGEGGGAISPATYAYWRSAASSGGSTRDT